MPLKPLPDVTGFEAEDIIGSWSLPPGEYRRMGGSVLVNFVDQFYLTNEDYEVAHDMAMMAIKIRTDHLVDRSIMKINGIFTENEGLDPHDLMWMALQGDISAEEAIARSEALLKGLM